MNGLVVSTEPPKRHHMQPDPVHQAHSVNALTRLNPSSMPGFHIRSHSQQNAQSHLGAASGILQAAQNLGSIGAPTGNLNALRTYPPSGDSANSTTGGYRNTISSTSGPPSSTALRSAPLNPPPQFSTRHEHQTSEGAGSMASQRGALSPRDYTPAGPRIGIEQSAPEAGQYHSGSGQLPGSLQPGRPGPISANTAPSVPTATSNMSQEQYPTPSRSTGLGLTHNYTRSSPAGFDGQGYAPFGSTTPGGNDYTSPTSKYAPQNAQRTVSNTPLGLADIRPRADSGQSDSPAGANPYSYDGANAVPTNSNYLAPWAIYAFDWCKWPAQGRDGGKVAVGSYLEDGHNFVGNSIFLSLLSANYLLP